MPLTREAFRQIGRMLRELGADTARLRKQYRTALRQRGHDRQRVQWLMQITPLGAASGRMGARRFLETASRAAEQLAKLNVPPEEVSGCLDAFDALLQDVAGERFVPVREQIRLATTLVLQNAFYKVRECEAQAFFGLSRAEIEAADFEDLLRRFAPVLGRVLRARTIRIVLTSEPALREPLYIERGRNARRLIADEKMRARYACFWSFPMGGGAVAQFGFPTRRRWLPREYLLLRSAAELCARAEERVRLEQDVRRLHAEARRAEEEERRRIGRELHDEAGQSLLLLRLELERVERSAPEPLRGALSRVRTEAERTIAELRRIVAALSPSVLERLGLEAALRRLGERFRAAHSWRLRMRLVPPAQPLEAETAQVIYRVAQEGLQNAAKHSNASRVNLRLDSTDREIRLSVSDDGAGFSAQAAGAKPMSFGLIGMQERAALLGGVLTVRSTPGNGTKIALRLPNPARAV